MRQHTLRPAGRAPLDALIATPPDTTGVLVYFPGFNTTLGPWEIAKCAHLADATSLTVVLTEIPGMSRFGDAIPREVRKEMLHGRVDANDEITDPVRAPLSLAETYEGNRHRYEGELKLDRTGPFGYTVRVVPHHEALASVAELGLAAGPSDPDDPSTPDLPAGSEF